METLLRIGLWNAVAAALLAVIAALATRVARRPALAHGLWLLVMLKLVTPPLATFEVDWPAPEEASTPRAAPAIPRAVVEDVPIPGPIEAAPEPSAPVESPRLERFEAAPAPEIEAERPAASSIGLVDRFRGLPIPSWSTLLAGAWLAGSIAWIGLAVGRLLRFHRRVRAAEPAPIEVQARSDRLAGRLGLRASPGVAMLPGAISPLLWALGRGPRLLVPAELWARLDEAQRDALLIHELAHLRRGDHLVRMLELVVGGLYWWFPVAWWARRALREAEEECCDAWVVWALPKSGRSYATALLEAVEFLSEPRRPLPLPLGASGMGQFRHLSRRISMIMKGSTPRRLSWVGLLGLFALAALLLPWLPSLSARQEPTAPQGTPATAAPGADIDEDGQLDVVVSEPIPAEDPRLIPDGADPAKLEEACDEVELLEATQRAKQAIVEVAASEVGFREKNLKRLQELMTKGAVDQAAVEEARAAHQNAVGQLAIRKAELGESAVRLRQAKRRLERLEAPRIAPRAIGPEGLPVPGASVRMPFGATEKQARRVRSVPMMPGGMPSATAAIPAPGSGDVENLKRIGLALHNYHGANGHLPPAAITGKDGKPLLSWRVAILPFLEDPTAPGLAQQFHLDEPWDSPHNRPLADRMPRIFAGADRPGPETPYKAIVGPGAGFEATEGKDFRDFTDGTSNTIVVVRTSTGSLWTKPEDLAFDPSDLLQAAQWKPRLDPDGRGFLALFADGAVGLVAPGTPSPTIRAFLTRNGGEVIPAGFVGPAPTARGGMPGASMMGMMGRGRGMPAGGMMMPGARMTPSGDSDRRLADLEAKMERLLKEMEAIRKDRAPTPEADDKPTAPAPKPGD